jgi:hypothetical protein
MKTVMYGLRFKRIGDVIVMCVSLVTSMVNRKILLTVYQTISEVDTKLTFLGQKEEVRRSNKQNRRNLVVLVAAVDMFYYIVGTWLMVATKESNFAAEFISIVFPLLVISNFNLTFCGITTALQDLFQIINSRIFKMTKRIEGASFCKSLEEQIAIHQNLTKSSKDVNSVFSLHLLLWIGLTFVASVLTLYIAVWLIVKNLVLKYPSFMINAFKNITTNFIDLFSFYHRSRQLCHEVSSFSSVNFTQKIFSGKQNQNLIVKSSIEDRRRK